MSLSAPHRMILITSGLVVALGVISVPFLLEPPKTVRLGVGRESVPLVQAHPALASQEARLPASNVAVPYSSRALDDRGKSLAADLDLPCGPSGQFSNAVTQIRLSGKACAKANAAQPFASTEIRNESNGFSATVFYPTTRTFTTDYISLAPGENKITISHVFKNGSHESREFLITR